MLYIRIRSKLKGRIRIRNRQSDKLDPDPHQFADDKPKCMENEPIWTLSSFWGFIGEDRIRIWIRIHIKVKSRFRIRIKVTSRIRIRNSVMRIRNPGKIKRKRLELGTNYSSDMHGSSSFNNNLESVSIFFCLQCFYLKYSNLISEKILSTKFFKLSVKQNKLKSNFFTLR